MINIGKLNNKMKEMEPRILMIGRTQEVIDVLIEELTPFGRIVMGSHEKEKIRAFMEAEKIDFAVMGGGIPDEARAEMKMFLEGIDPNVPVHLIERTEKGGPFKLIEFTNQKAVEWKIKRKFNH